MYTLKNQGPCSDHTVDTVLNSDMITDVNSNILGKILPIAVVIVRQ